MYVHILYLMGEDATIAILCIGLPITTTIVDVWLTNLIFHKDIECITTNGQTIIYVGANYICQVTAIEFTHKFWEVPSHF